MSTENQLSVLKHIFLDKTKLLYDNSFMMKLTVASKKNPNWFENQLNIIDALCVQFDESLMLKNPKRALKYLLVLSKTISDLEFHTNHNTLEFERQILLML